MLSPEEEIKELFLKKKWTLSVAESCTGGRIAAKITRIGGSSDYFLGGVIAYTISLKKKLLNVSGHTIDSFGVVSIQVAQEMARGACEQFGSSVALATTGIAGPLGGTEKTLVGTVCFAIEGRVSASWTSYFEGNREKILESASTQCLEKLIDLFKEKKL